MGKKEIIARIDKLHDRLVRLQGEDNALVKTIANLNSQRASIKRRNKTIHEEIAKLQVEVLKMGL